jgi:hypothetical protein
MRDGIGPPPSRLERKEVLEEMLIVLNKKHQEFLLFELLKGACNLAEACTLTGLTLNQGEYILEKSGTTARGMRQHYKLKTATRDAVRVAADLLKRGATGEEVAMITGLTVDQMIQLSDPDAEYWFE